MSRYIIDWEVKETNDASSKPKRDINNILMDDFNFKKLRLLRIPRVNEHVLHNYRIKRCFKNTNLNEKDLIIMNYPMYIGEKFGKKLSDYVHKRNATIVAFIHDIDSLRGLVGFNSVNEEAEYLNNFDAVISPNEVMTKKLKSSGYKKPAFNLGIFDYLSNETHKENGIEYKNEVVFAGNLNKSTFLHEFKATEDMRVDLYGNCDDLNSLNDTLNYKGSFSPQKLTEELGQGFGLVWDGNSVKNINGKFGEYLLYNNPYKACMYLSVGMPLIVWDKSAIATFVKNNSCGITVNGINDLDSTLDKVSPSEFEKLCKNSKDLSEKVRNGYFTKKVVNQLLDYLKK